jgi:hypothetical protein
VSTMNLYFDYRNWYSIHVMYCPLQNPSIL